MSSARAYVGPSPFERSIMRANVLTWRAIELEAAGDLRRARTLETLGQAELAMARYHGELASRGIETNASVGIVSDELLGLVAPEVVADAGVGDELADERPPIGLTRLGLEAVDVARAIGGVP